MCSSDLSVFEDIKSRYYWEKDFIQAVKEVFESIGPLMSANLKYHSSRVLERIVEPERIICFRVPWIDDKGKLNINRGFRVQFNSAIGPYKGGIRFHPDVTLDTLKFLGFEQTFKNSLTGLPMGGGKGGSDFDPNGKSDNEIMTFCQSFMIELFRHIGPNTDVPAGDIGVGGREIGYLFGMYKRLANEFSGVLTGKGLSFGGSLIRPEATGFGGIYFAQEMLNKMNDSIEGKKIAVSGFGNVAWGVVRKATELGAKVITLSGPDGYVYDKDGVSSEEKCNYLITMRSSGRNRVQDYAERFGAAFYPGKKPWGIPTDIAIPCAIQNELNLQDAKKLVSNGCRYIIELSNMGCTSEASSYASKKITFVPGKAANAGGVAVSGLEMSQNSIRFNWSAEEVDWKLKEIMRRIHDTCADTAVEYGLKANNYISGANIAGFKKVADAMISQGAV